MLQTQGIIRWSYPLTSFRSISILLDDVLRGPFHLLLQASTSVSARLPRKDATSGERCCRTKTMDTLGQIGSPLFSTRPLRVERKGIHMIFNNSPMISHLPSLVIPCDPISSFSCSLLPRESLRYISMLP